MKSNESASERGQTTLEYTLVFAFMMSISIFASMWLINVLRKWVAVLAVKTAIFLTGS
jgi:hypothetical protein